MISWCGGPWWTSRIAYDFDANKIYEGRNKKFKKWAQDVVNGLQSEFVEVLLNLVLNVLAKHSLVFRITWKGIYDIIGIIYGVAVSCEILSM